MIRVNLLPHREEKRQRRHQQFLVLAAISLVISLLVAGTVWFFLDTQVDAWVDSLARKLPETTRYAKQQLNVWRDFAWSSTIGHARDWLAMSMLGEEAQSAVRAFLERKQ